MRAYNTLKGNLNENDLLHFSIGLVLSMLFVIVMFEWKSYDVAELTSIGSTYETNNDDFLEIPPSEQTLPPPPPRRIQAVNIVEVHEEEIIDIVEIDLDIDITEDTKFEDYDNTPIEIELEEEEEETDEIFLIVETPSVPIGGYAQFYADVSEKMRYPSQARRLGVEGKVFVQFVVDKTGAITNVKVVKGIGAGCDEEAIKVIESMPNWSPAKQRGKPVRVMMVLPITFKLK